MTPPPSGLENRRLAALEDGGGVQHLPGQPDPLNAGWRGRMRGTGIAVLAWDAIAWASGPGLACAGGLVVAVRGCRGRWW